MNDSNAPSSNSEYRWLDDDGPAFGAPGVPPRWTSSKKDAVSTAYSASSRIWFTISHGTLNEVYFPTIDRPQVRDMELLFTDEETFFHEEKRDFEYDFHYVDPGAPLVRVVASDLDGRYTVTKEYIADPHHPVILMNVKIAGDEAILSRLKCYALLAPHLDGGGAGNSARSISIAGHRALLAWKNNFSLAMGVDCGFTRSSCGYVGTSDGFQDLSNNLRMDWNFGKALDGNIAVMGEIDVAKNREFTIAIALGHGFHAALSGMVQTLTTPLRHPRPTLHRAMAPGRVPDRPRQGLLRQRPARPRQPQHHPHPRGQDLLRSLHRLRVHPLGSLQRRRRSRRLSPRLDPRHGPVRHRTTRLRTHRDRPPRPRLSGMHPAPRRRLRPELLDRRNRLLDRYPARRGRLPHHPRLAALEGRWTR